MQFFCLLKVRNNADLNPHFWCRNVQQYCLFLSTETSLEICKLHRNIGKTGATVLQAVTTSKSAFRIRIKGEASWIRLEEVQKYRLQTATQVEQQKYFPFFQKKNCCALCFLRSLFQISIVGHMSAKSAKFFI